MDLHIDELKQKAENMMRIGSTISIVCINDNGTSSTKVDGVVIGFYPYGFLCSMQVGRYNEFFCYDLLRSRENGTKLVVRRK